MSKYLDISIDNLQINPANDRHGDLGSEKKAIEWLLVNKTEKMKNLLKDIITIKKILEPPLVMQVPGKNLFKVYDGNRRVTCLKLLHGLVPDEISNPLKDKISIFLDGRPNEVEKIIRCRVEKNINTVNDLLERRHIPGNSGAGQLKWDAHEKQTFLDRTGKTTKINFAKEINQMLIEEHKLNKNERIPLSNFNRLFSSNKFRERVGIEVKGNIIQITHDPFVVYKSLTRIAKDMIDGIKTLDDVWNNDKKSLYLDELERENILPSANNRLIKPIELTKRKSNIVYKSKLVRKDRTLFHSSIPTPTQNEYFSDKFCTLFNELQNTLHFDKHIISISISLRTFIELLTNAYSNKFSISTVKTHLHQKIKNAFSHMKLINIQVPAECEAFINKIGDADEYFSINTLHKNTHHSFQISENDLRTYVNNLDFYVRNAITAVNQK